MYRIRHRRLRADCSLVFENTSCSNELRFDQRGGKVGFCETIRKHSPLSGAKRNSHAICRRNSGRHFADGTRTGC